MRVEEIGGQGRSCSPGAKSLVTTGMLGVTNTFHFRCAFRGSWPRESKSGVDMSSPVDPAVLSSACRSVRKEQKTRPHIAATPMNFRRVKDSIPASCLIAMLSLAMWLLSLSADPSKAHRENRKRETQMSDE